MKRPKNIDLYLEAEKMIFMSSVQNVVVMWRLEIKKKMQFINTSLQKTYIYQEFGCLSKVGNHSWEQQEGSFYWKRAYLLPSTTVANYTEV